MRPSLFIAISIGLFLCPIAGCTHLNKHPSEPPNPPLKIAVGPVTMMAPISKSTTIHSFDETPPSEIEPTVRAQLIEEVEIKAQRILTEHLALQPGFEVVPFDEIRRLQADIERPQGKWDEERLRQLGRQAKTDLVVSGQILDFGAVQKKYWVTGLVLHSGAGLLALGFATGWNPAAIGAYVAYELPDVFIWGGGAYMLGWAFRPVRIEVQAIQITHCEGDIWVDQELKITVPRKTLAAFSAEDRKRKEVQLGVNLDRALEDVSAHAGEELRLQECTPEGRPAKRKTLPFLTLFGLGH